MKNKIFFAFIISLVIIVAIVFSSMNKNVKVMIEFDNVPDIKVGYVLMYDGVEAGEIIDIVYNKERAKIIALAEVYSKYAKTLNESSVFIVEPSDARHPERVNNIAIIVLDDKAPPIKEGQSFTGYGSRIEFAAVHGMKTLKKAFKDIKGIIGGAFGGNEGSQDEKKPEVGGEETDRLERLKKEIDRLFEELHSATQKGMEILRKEIPRMKNDFNKLIRELRRYEKDREADEYEKRFNDQIEYTQQTDLIISPFGAIA